MNEENEVSHIVFIYHTHLEKNPERPCKTNPLNYQLDCQYCTKSINFKKGK
jgi:hypothetical protein